MSKVNSVQAHVCEIVVDAVPNTTTAVQLVASLPSVYVLPRLSVSLRSTLAAQVWANIPNVAMHDSLRVLLYARCLSHMPTETKQERNIDDIILPTCYQLSSLE